MMTVLREFENFSIKSTMIILACLFLAQYFDTSHSVIGLGFSVYTFTASFFGFFSNLLINRFGCRLVVFMGGACHVLGLLACTLTPDPYTFGLSLGLLLGMGNSLVYNGTTLIIPQYFDKVP